MILLEVKETGIVPRGMRKAFGEAQRLSFFAAGRWWHTEIRQKKFTTAGGTEYGYQPRQGERGDRSGKGFRRTYTGRTLRQMGHTRPLEYSGETRVLTGISRVAATRTGVRIVYPHARKLNYRRTPAAPNMRDEFTRVSIGDRRAAIAIINRELDKELAKLSQSGGTKTEQIR